MKINENYKKNLKKDGYVIVKKFLPKKKLNLILKNCKIIDNIAREGKWPFLSVYNDFPHFNKKINIFGINYPLNYNLDKTLFSQINRIEYSKLIKKITGWKNFATTLIRLHSFKNFYNYYGGWHRDDKSYPSPNSIQSVLYLKNEAGFRIIPKYNLKKLTKFGIKLTGETKNKKYSDKELPKNLYKTIVAEEGDLLFFESGLLHQGYCLSERLHFHMRHEKIKKIKLSKHNKMNFVKEYLPDTPIDELKKLFPEFTVKKAFKYRTKRAVSFVQYFFPRLKVIANNFKSKSNLKENFFKNTIWQNIL